MLIYSLPYIYDWPISLQTDRPFNWQIKSDLEWKVIIKYCLEERGMESNFHLTSIMTYIFRAE